MPSGSPGAPTAHVWWALLPDLLPGLGALAGGLSGSERRRAAGFRGEPDRVAFSLAHGLRNTILGQYPGGLDHSLSRTGGAAACAVGLDTAVGLDIERVERLPDLRELAEAVATPGERAAFDRLPEAGRTRAFYLLWVCKEAVLKCEGSGLGIAPATLEVGPGCWSGGPFEVRMGDRGFSVRTFGFAEHYVGALAAAREPGEVRVARFGLPGQPCQNARSSARIESETSSLGESANQPSG